MAVIDEKTKVPLGLVIALLTAVAGGVLMGSKWAWEVKYDIADLRKDVAAIKRHMGIGVEHARRQVNETETNSN